MVIDCGASTVKMGWAEESLINPTRIAPNFVTRGKGAQNKLVAEQIESCRDYTGIFMKRPYDKGYLLNWQLQKQIWRLPEMYKEIGKKFNPSETNLLLTEPLFNPDSLRKNMYEVIFEDYGFKSLCNCTSPMLSLYDYQTNHPHVASNPCALVIDSGYSFTHVVPFFDNVKLTYAIKRINVGGKLLTNYLKEVVSYRQWNMTQETYLMNIIKEKLCYVPLNFLKDLEITKLKGDKNNIKRRYVLPDNITNTTGYIKDLEPKPSSYNLLGGNSGPLEEQILTMNSERLIPEVLFNPSDIGIDQAGIAETIVQSVSSTSPDIHELLYSNILLTGGNTLFPGFKERLEIELRQLVPTEYKINVHLPKEYRPSRLSQLISLLVPS
uniref:Actin-related protein 6 n=1 Tax=Arcella intermedia TaxID=1963864 RepID=A0A6B2L6W2_9EUKA